MSEVGSEEADISAHDAKVRNLLPFYPEINRLGTYPKKFRSLLDVPRPVIG